MLEYGARWMHGLTISTNIEVSYCGGDHQTVDCSPSLHRLTLTELRLSSYQTTETINNRLLDIKEGRPVYCPGAQYFESLEQQLESDTDKGIETQSSRISSSCNVLPKRNATMLSVEHIKGLYTVRSGYWRQFNERKSLVGDVQEQKEDWRNKGQRGGHVQDRSSKLSFEYFCSDFELTVVYMAETSSRTSSDDGCTPPLDGAGTAAESLSKGSVTTDKQQSAESSFTISIQGNVDGRRRQRESSSAAQESEEMQCKLHPRVPVDEAKQEAKFTSRKSDDSDKRACSAAARNPAHVVGRAIQVGGEEDENWLQLGIGSTFSELHRVHAAPYRSRSSEHSTASDHRQQQDLATLALMPQSSDNELTKNWELSSTPRRGYDSMSRSENEAGRLRPFMVPITVRHHPEEASNRYFTEPSFYMETSENQESVQQFVSHLTEPSSSLLPGRDMPFSNKRLSSFPLYSGNQCYIATRNNETRCPTDPRSLEEEASVTRMVVSNNLAGYPYFVQNQTASGGCPRGLSEDRRIPCGQAPMLSVVVRDSGEESVWPPPVGSSKDSTCPAFQEQTSTEMARRVVDPSLRLIDPTVAPQPSRLGFQGDSNPLEEWQTIVRRFGSNLRFQNLESDGSLRLTGNLLPTQDVTALQAAIDRLQASRSHGWESRNIASHVSSSWNSSTFAQSLLRPNASEIAERRMFAGGLVERASPAAALAHCGTDRSFLPRNHAQVSTRNFGSLVQRPRPFLSEVVRLTKPSRGQPGIWFTLHAAENQNDDGVLPQIPKTYLRIKDEKMTISVVEKYLVAKLGLSTESEVLYPITKSHFFFINLEQVEITCRGQIILSSFSLQHVRDEIWFSNDLSRGETLKFRLSSNSTSTSKDHIMILTYQKRIQLTT